MLKKDTERKGSIFQLDSVIEVAQRKESKMSAI